MESLHAPCFISRTSLSFGLIGRSVGLTTGGLPRTWWLSRTAAGSGDALIVRLPYMEELISRIRLEILALGRIVVFGETNTAIMELSNTSIWGGYHVGG